MLLLACLHSVKAELTFLLFQCMHVDQSLTLLRQNLQEVIGVIGYNFKIIQIPLLNLYTLHGSLNVKTKKKEIQKH